jgi:Transcriptional regulator containing an amidase domain and an AraC-type DNA-binding HTH domain
VRVEKLLEQRNNFRKKFNQAIVEGKEAEIQRTDADRRFLCKIIDNTYILMEKRELDINTLANKLCMSPRQFHRKVMAVTGETPATYLLQIKMRRAKQLFDTKPNLSIDEVADSCGFDHYSSFYHAFKKMYGITPSQYKRSAK